MNVKKINNIVDEKGCLSLRITKDKMSAYLTVRYDKLEGDLTKELIVSFIKSKGIVYGIDEDAITQMIDNKQRISNILVVSGTRPVKGNNGIADIQFDLNECILPIINASGAINFEDLKPPKYIEKDTVLISLLEPLDGVGGKDIFSNNIKAPKGDDCNIAIGEGCALSEEGKKIRATKGGYIRYNGNAIEIVSAIYMDNDIEAGNYDENIIIAGNIHKNIKIQTTESIIVCGSIDGVEVTANNVIVHNSINGRQKFEVRAMNSIICKNVINAVFVCGGNLYSECIVNSSVKAGGSIIAVSNEGQIKSGRYIAGEKIIANEIGMEEGSSIIVSIWQDWYAIENNLYGMQIKRLKELENEISQLREQKDILDNKLENIKGINVSESGMIKRTDIIKILLLEKAKINLKIKSAQQEYNDVFKQRSSKTFEIICNENIYKGVNVRIGKTGYSVMDTMNAVKFYTKDDDVLLYGSINDKK